MAKQRKHDKGMSVLFATHGCTVPANGGPTKWVSARTVLAKVAATRKDLTFASGELHQSLSRLIDDGLVAYRDYEGPTVEGRGGTPQYEYAVTKEGRERVKQLLALTR